MSTPSPEAIRSFLRRGASPRAPETIISIEDVKSALNYCPESGLLSWRYRHGGSIGDKRFNARYFGCPVGNEHNGYLRLSLKQKFYTGHRIAWAIHYGRWPQDVIDHIDGDGMNNRIANLRECTQAENMRSRGPNRDNRSGVRGVHWSKSHGMWCARLTVAGKVHRFGRYKTIEEAAAVIREKSPNVLGDFCRMTCADKSRRQG